VERWKVGILVFDGVAALDVAGPFEVLTRARLEPGVESRRADDQALFDVFTVARTHDPVTATGGLVLVPRHAFADAPAIDLLLVPGGFGTRPLLQDKETIAWIRATAAAARRTASVCTGALLLARAGLLDGRRATTHWSACDALARRHPRVRVEPDPIFVRDGDVYTSAGVTSGMDLALALVEEDHGRELALAVARGLVLFLKRPGGQSQFSAQLSSQLASRQPLQELQAWIVENVHADLSVDALAARVGMSPRNFARVFTREVGATPALFVEIARVEAARRRLEEDGGRGIEAVAAECGFGSAETMRRAFLRRVRVSPSDYRTRFQANLSS
jgi:transcriptional regulator GlxA family with amidase domain